MSYEDTIEEIIKAVEQRQRELEELQITANQLCKLAGIPPKYEIGKRNEEVSQEKLKGDEFYGKPLATAITEILQRRKAKDMGPATMDEIYNQMIAGGYGFDNIKDPKRAIGISMGKNPKFTKLRNEKWALTEWYPNVKEKKVAASVIIGPEDKQPQQEAETPVVVKKVERPKKVEQPENKQDEPKE